MRILYGIQGTGHGHISRAKVILPILREQASVDVLISGYNFHLQVDGRIKFKKRGLSLAYDNNGGIDFLETAMSIKPVRFLKDVREIPVKEYDFVINDFEPITAWAAFKAGVPCVAISHQAAFLSDKSPRPKQPSIMSEMLMRHFAPCSSAIACHYLRYDSFIEPPIVRRAVQELNPTEGEHITVYLPAYHHSQLIDIFRQISHVRWDIFSPYTGCSQQNNNVTVHPLSKGVFLKSIENSLGIISSAGFETSSEAMFLRKKLLCIPIRNQYEQLCNVAAIEKQGGKSLSQINESSIGFLRNWINDAPVMSLSETSNDVQLVSKIISSGINSFPISTVA